MSKRFMVPLAWSLWAFSILGTLVGQWLDWANNPQDFRLELLYLVEHLVAFGTLITLGLLIVVRRRNNPIGWIALLAGTAAIFGNCLQLYALYVILTHPAALPASGPTVYALALAGVALSKVGIYAATSFILLLFPNGHLPSPRWRPFAWLVAGLQLVDATASLFTPRVAALSGHSVANPLGVGAVSDMASWVVGVSDNLIFPCIVICAGSILLRFRSARGDERQQLKWVAYAAGLEGVLFSIALLLTAQFPEIDKNPVLLAISDFVYSFVLGAFPLAVGIAVLKYRLYEIDVLIHRTLVYATLTALLAGLYFGGVVVFESLLRPFTGSARSELGVVGSTLLIAALFAPLRQRIQAFIDRRFYRRKYDAARTLAAFSAQLSDAVDLDELAGRLVGVVEETMRPAHAALWLNQHGEE